MENKAMQLLYPDFYRLIAPKAVKKYRKCIGSGCDEMVLSNNAGHRYCGVCAAKAKRTSRRAESAIVCESHSLLQTPGLNT